MSGGEPDQAPHGDPLSPVERQEGWDLDKRETGGPRLGEEKQAAPGRRLKEFHLERG